MTCVGAKMRRFCAVLVGFVFFVAGILKLMDPVGTMLIVKEYMNFLHMGFLRVLAGPVAEIFALTETFLGVCLITGVFRKVTAVVTTILLGGFTILTLLLWIFNPSMDCGCFGEAVRLTHFQSFAKNVVLCALVFAAFVPYRMFGQPKKRKYVTFGLVGVAVIAFAVYSLMYIPMLELTPFNLSTELAAAVDVVEEEPDEDEYISTFVYEKNGKTGVFTLNNLPDSTWTFVETRTVRRQANLDGSEHPSLAFRDAENKYRDTLAVKDLVMVVSVPEPSKLKASAWGEIARFIGNASESGFTPLLLVADGPEHFSRGISGLGLQQGEELTLLTSVYYADYKELISLNRSNGGAVYFNDGRLISKWAARSLPSQRKLQKLVRQNSTEVMLSADGKGRRSFEAFMLYSVVMMLLI